MAGPHSYNKFVTERNEYHVVYANSIGTIYQLIAEGKNMLTPKESPAAKTICILNQLAADAIIGEGLLNDVGKAITVKEKVAVLEQEDIYELYYQMMIKMYSAGLVAIERRKSSLERVDIDKKD